MAPCEVSATVKATPETIWSTCFEPMKWESWDPDLNAVSDVSTDCCEEGTTCVFEMKDGSNIPITLSNVEKNFLLLIYVFTCFIGRGRTD